MKTLAVVIGNRTEKEFARIIRELKALQFTYSPGPKEWTKEIDDDRADWWLEQMKQSGVQCYFKD